MTRFPAATRPALRSLAGAFTMGALGLVGLAGATRSLHAQLPVSKPISIGIDGGLAVPTGRLGDNLNAGYSVGAFAEFHPAPGPLSFRIEGGYDRFATKDSYTAATVDGVDYGVFGNTHFYRGNANLVLRVPSTGGFRPYLTGGVGIYGLGGGYTVRDDFGTVSTSDRTQVKLGFNGGVGIEYPLTGITVFLDARVHGVQTDATPVTYIPITVGIRF